LVDCADTSDRADLPKHDLDSELVEHQGKGHDLGGSDVPHLTRSMTEALAAMGLEILRPTADRPGTLVRSRGRVGFPELLAAGATGRPAGAVRLTSRPLEWPG
jgi:hypothetical protein